MPIYAYRCASCGHAQDVLQKLSDEPLSQCPACGAASFAKQLTAAGFQLKGSGWYATDFRGGNQAAAKKDGESEAPRDDKAAEKSADKPAEKAADKPAAPAPAANSTAAPPPAAASS